MDEDGQEYFGWLARGDSLIQDAEILFAGAGLANGLAAYRLKQQNPNLNFLIADRAPSAGGNHTWSFHETDVTPSELEWLAPFISGSWNSHRVIFPEFSRELSGKYFSIRSSQFHKVLSATLGDSLVLNQVVQNLNSDGAFLPGMGEIKAKVVIDGRGWQSFETCPLGYQKFLGQFVRTKKPHGLVAPILMDVTWPQLDGFRFFYVLPFGENCLLIEDTRYSDAPEVDVLDSRKAIRRYAELKDWEIEFVEHEEVGSLPIPLAGKFPKSESPALCSGLRAGLFHATTGYSLPHAVRFASALAAVAERDPASIYSQLSSYAEMHWASQSFYRFLNRMLFQAAKPSQRYRVLQRFYRLPERAIARFYSGRLNWQDKTRILVGRPPVPIWSAIRCLREGNLAHAYA